jgi:DNA-binding transcriptional LysR family regulator
MPVVSKTIADLEHALGVRLLDRTSQGVEPTAYGHSFIHCGTAVFDEMRRGVQGIEFLADPTAGEMRIGVASPYIDFVTAAVARLAARYPRIEWYVSEGDTPAPVEIITVKDRTPNPIATLFIKELRDLARPLAKRK